MPIPGGPFSGTSDWPVPRAVRERKGLRTWVQKAGAFLVDTVMPCTVALCIVPWGPARANTLLTHINATQTQLIGKDKFFGLAGAPNFDWPNPRGPLQPAVTSRTHLHPVRLNLLGQDTFFGPPGCGPDYDWPNPRGPVPAISLKTHISAVRLNLLGRDTFFGGPGCGPDYDWPNPSLGPKRSVDLVTWLQSTDLELIGQDKFFGAPGQGPTFDWPNARGASSAIDLKTSTAAGLSLTAVTPAPFNQDDWPNPRASSASLELRTWLQSTSALLSGSPAFMPSATTSWLNPWGPARRPLSFTFTLIPPTAAKPFAQTDWPIAKGPVGSIDLRTWINLSSALYNVTYVFRQPTVFRNWSTDARVAINSQLPSNLSILTAPPPPEPFFQSDWPNPKGPVAATDLRTWLQQSSVSLQSSLPKFVPSVATSWLNPWAAASSFELRSWLQRASLALTTPTGPQPFVQSDWPNPRAPLRATSLLTHIDPLKLTLFGRDQFFGLAGRPNFDWPNPRAYVPAIDLRTWWQGISLSIQVVPQVPAHQTDWPIPRGPSRATSLLTHVDPLKLTLFGRDQFFGLAGKPNYDWPNPQRIVRVVETSIGTFRALITPVSVPFSPIWPNPATRVDSVNRLTWTERGFLLRQPIVNPFTPLLWPNPRTSPWTLYAYGSSGSSIRPPIVVTGAPSRIAVALPRNRVAVANARSRVIIKARNAMSQATTLQPQIDADGEQENVFFDYSRILSNGAILINIVSVTCELFSGSDPSPSSRILSVPTITTSTLSNRANTAVAILIGNMLPTCTYRLTCIAQTSDGQTLSLWSRISSQAPN